MKRTVVITGGTKGLGRELALVFGNAGYFVVALYASDDAVAEQLRVPLDATKGRGCVLRHDVTSEDPAVWNHPEIQEADSLALIHNACASFSPVPMHQLSYRDFESSLDVGLKGAWLCSGALIRLMLKKGGGVIVNVLTSAIGGPAPKGFAPYVTAKHALRGFTLALAAEYRPRGLRVFTVSPGFMDTPLTQGWDARLRDAIRSASPRITEPVAAANRVLELVEKGAQPGNGEDYPI
jgi:glucose 1-dehydrogenase